MITIPSLKVYKKRNQIPGKRAFFLSSGSFWKVNGSMAVEGSLVLPIFLFFMLTILLSMEAVRFQSDMMEAMHQAGNQSVVQAYQVKYENAENMNVNNEIMTYLDSQLLPYLCVKGGKEGVQIKDLSSEQSGMVEILSEYKLASFIWWLPVGEIAVEDRFLSHAWTGYCGQEDQGTNREREIYVYVTETGTKYHLSVDCSYLKVQVKAVDAGSLEEKRNQWGGKYYPCKKCKPEKSGTVYITSDGNSYHSQGNCSGLKRTVYLILLSKATGYSPCSRCAG